jgi:hypothetical protein
MICLFCRQLDPTAEELQLLREAAEDHEQLDELARDYTNLREMLHTEGKENEFRREFSRVYALNGAGLTKKWKDAYFSLLFEYRNEMPKNPHATALHRLKNIAHSRGHKAIQFSFVTKMVAIHDESQPLFDKYVQNFFGLGAPAIRQHDEFRIAGFIHNL